MHGRTLLSCIFLLSLRSDVILEHTQTFFFHEGSCCGQRGESEENRTLPREERGGWMGRAAKEIQDKFWDGTSGNVFHVTSVACGHAIPPKKKKKCPNNYLSSSSAGIFLSVLVLLSLGAEAAAAAKGLFTKNLEREKTKGWFLLPSLHKFPTVFRNIFWIVKKPVASGLLFFFSLDIGTSRSCIKYYFSPSPRFPRFFWKGVKYDVCIFFSCTMWEKFEMRPTWLPGPARPRKIREVWGLSISPPISLSPHTITPKPFFASKNGGGMNLNGGCLIFKSGKPSASITFFCKPK